MRTKGKLTIGALLAAGVAVVALVAGPVQAAQVKIGTLVLRADGGFAPRVLPQRRYVPIRFQGHAEIGTTDGSVPPALRHVKLEFDRDGRLTSTGLAVCLPGRIEATTTQQARRRCRGAIVGTGHVGAVVSLAGSRLKFRVPLTLFNGPRQGGHQTIVAHARATAPISQSYVVVVPIERRRGAYRYRVSVDVPTIAGGAGALTHIDMKIGRRYRHRGVRRSYVSARCSDGILQTKGNFSFADGTIVYGAIFKGCRTP